MPPAGHLWSQRPEWLEVPAAPQGTALRGLAVDPHIPPRLTCFVEGRDPGSVRGQLDRLGIDAALKSMGVLDGSEPGRGLGAWEIELSDPSPVGCLGLAPSDAAPGDEYLATRQRLLSKHALDVALSRGRHAVERAKLAGTPFFVGLAWSRETGDAASPPRAMGGDPYRTLALLADPEIIALVGAAISAGQIGLPMFCFGRSGEAAISAVGRLHPGVLGWLMSVPDERGMRALRSRQSTRPPYCIGAQSVTEDLQALAAAG
ncbi:hypothetical protein D779_1084 [Imhoffiella purpurea]|uniref:Uncharacterized protein n=2 Tax=Imhoffiella purpurea TaxID=1249627 RepID=W9VFB5_9GAMM|nr:hypothetical protein D779_1084 [Imhoffiella purpurea]